MKLVLAIALLCLCEQSVFGSWLAESKANQGDELCPKGQVASGFIFKEVSQQAASSQSSNSSGQSQGADGSSGQSSAQSASSQVSSFKKVSLRVFCTNLDGSSKVASSGKGEAGRECTGFTLQEGSKVDDQDKNCKDGEFISGVKLSDGPKITVVCSKSEEYEVDSSIEARTIGPIKFRKGEPAQAQNPSKANDNGKCQVDAAVALGVSDEGVTIKVQSFKKKGKSYDASCKEKKEEAAKEANSKSSTNSSSSTQTNSSSTETSESSSNSTTEETRSMNTTETEKSEKSGGDEEPCVCVCNQVCGGEDCGCQDKGGDKKGKGSGSGGKKGKGKGRGPDGNGPPGQNKRGKRSGSGGKGKKKGHKKGSGSGSGGKSHSHKSSSSSSSSFSETRSESSSSSFSSSSSSSSTTTTTSSTLEVKETTYEGKSVFMVSNSKKLKRCPEAECNCPCVCKGGAGGKKKAGGGSNSGQGSSSHSGSKSKGKKESSSKSGSGSKSKKGGKGKKGNNGNGKGKGK